MSDIYIACSVDDGPGVRISSILGNNNDEDHDEVDDEEEHAHVLSNAKVVDEGIIQQH